MSGKQRGSWVSTCRVLDQGEVCVGVCMHMHACVWLGEVQKIRVKSTGMSPNPLRISPLTVAHRSSNGTSPLLYNHLILVFITKAGKRGRHQRMHMHTAQQGKVLEALFAKRKILANVQRRIISLPCCFTSILGNLFELQLCQSLPFLSLAPLRCQLHIVLGFRLVGSQIYLCSCWAHMLFLITIIVFTYSPYTHLRASAGASASTRHFEAQVLCSSTLPRLKECYLIYLSCYKFEKFSADDKRMKCSHSRLLFDSRVMYHFQALAL